MFDPLHKPRMRITDVRVSEDAGRFCAYLPWQPYGSQQAFADTASQAVRKLGYDLGMQPGFDIVYCGECATDGFTKWTLVEVLGG